MFTSVIAGGGSTRDFINKPRAVLAARPTSWTQLELKRSGYRDLVARALRFGAGGSRWPSQFATASSEL